MDRTNETWMAELSSGGVAEQRALEDLRRVLLGGLRAALRSNPAADDALLEDAAQEALVRVLGRLDQFEGRARFTTWAMSIAIRVALSELRHRRFRDVSLEAFLASPASVVPAAAAIDEPDVERRALVRAMHHALEAGLTERQRTALVAELNGMPQDEIARHLGSNRNAIYKLTHDARKRLKRTLEAAGYGAEHVRSAFGA